MVQTYLLDEERHPASSAAITFMSNLISWWFRLVPQSCNGWCYFRFDFQFQFHFFPGYWWYSIHPTVCFSFSTVPTELENVVSRGSVNLCPFMNLCVCMSQSRKFSGNKRLNRSVFFCYCRLMHIDKRIFPHFNKIVCIRNFHFRGQNVDILLFSSVLYYYFYYCSARTMLKYNVWIAVLWQWLNREKSVSEFHFFAVNNMRAGTVWHEIF